MFKAIWDIENVMHKPRNECVLENEIKCRPTAESKSRS